MTKDQFLRSHNIIGNSNISRTHACTHTHIHTPPINLQLLPSNRGLPYTPPTTATPAITTVQTVDRPTAETQLVPSTSTESPPLLDESEKLSVSVVAIISTLVVCTVVLSLAILASRIIIMMWNKNK